jgi:exopolysaccharide production protein ExoQ
MSSAIALVLSAVLSISFLVSDRRRNPGVSAATWLTTIWFMIAISKPLSYWLNPWVSLDVSRMDYSQGSPVDRAILGLLMALALLVLLSRRLDWGELSARNSMLFLVMGFVALSIAWSGYRLVALKALIRTLGDVMMALIIIIEPSPLDAVRAVIRRTAFILLPVSIVLIKYFRMLGVGYGIWDGKEMWVGVTSNKNSLGMLTTVIALCFATDLIATWRKRVSSGERFTQMVFLALSLYLLIGSKSATSLVCFVIGVMVYGLSHGLRKSASYIGRLYFGLLFAAVIFYLTMFGPLLAVLGRDITLTSRTFIWRELLQVGSRHPILGVGYASLWIGKLGNELIRRVGLINQAHNGYLEIYLHLGIVGVFLTIIMIAQGYRNIIAAIREDFAYGILRMTYLSVIILSNITESSLLRSTELLWVLFLMVIMQPPDNSLFRLQNLQTSKSAAVTLL